MQGLGLKAGFSYTPVATGNVIVVLSCQLKNGTASDGGNAQGRYGTGVAPSVNGAASGNQFGATQTFSTASSSAGGTSMNWTVVIMGRITGLALNTAVWFDLALETVTGGAVTGNGPQIVIHEA
jgi:hypothetical protein